MTKHSSSEVQNASCISEGLGKLILNLCSSLSGDDLQIEVRRGRHSRVYLTEEYAIKVFHSRFSRNFEKEVYFLELLKPYGFVPQLLFADFKNLAVVMRRIRGKFLEEAMREEIILKCLEVCFTLDKLGIQKEEMNHPQKHILVSDGKVFFLDFERSHLSKRPSNLTQFCSYLRSLGLKVEKELLREYKSMYSSEAFERIKKCVLLFC